MCVCVRACVRARARARASSQYDSGVSLADLPNRAVSVN